MSNYIGTRCIGGRKSARTLLALRAITEKIIVLCGENYRPAAITVVKEGNTKVFVPASMDEESIDGVFESLQEVQSYGNTKGEPCYTSLDAGIRGHNEDGSEHGGFLVIDPIERLVIDLVDKTGKTKLRTPLVRFATPEKVLV